MTKEAAVNTFPFLSILTLVFIAAKLFGAIHWSWWWVLSPLWIPYGFLLFIVSIIFIIGGIVYLFGGGKSNANL